MAGEAKHGQRRERSESPAQELAVASFRLANEAAAARSIVWGRCLRVLWPMYRWYGAPPARQRDPTPFGREGCSGAIIRLGVTGAAKARKKVGQLPAGR